MWTLRNLWTELLSNSGVAEHHHKTGHQILFNSAFVVVKSSNYVPTRIGGAIELSKHLFHLIEKKSVHKIYLIIRTIFDYSALSVLRAHCKDWKKKQNYVNTTEVSLKNIVKEI